MTNRVTRNGPSIRLRFPWVQLDRLSLWKFCNILVSLRHVVIVPHFLSCILITLLYICHEEFIQRYSCWFHCQKEACYIQYDAHKSWSPEVGNRTVNEILLPRGMCRTESKVFWGSFSSCLCTWAKSKDDGLPGSETVLCWNYNEILTGLSIDFRVETICTGETDLWNQDTGVASEQCWTHPSEVQLCSANWRSSVNY